jgi:acyl carrier protein
VLARGEGAARALTAVVVAAAGGNGHRRSGDEAREMAPRAKEALREHLREQLPEYMVPSEWVAVGELPLTANGKVDRRRLEAALAALAGAGGSRRAAARGAPASETERVIAEAWCEVLRRREVGVEDDFFELGGQSLLATQVISRIRDRLDVSLPLRRLFDSPTVAALAAAVDELRRTGRAAPTPALRALPRRPAGQQGDHEGEGA